ncbi:glycosyltransferase [Planomonospora corallina]|uniref:Glycosyltransferase n=1 Tax=Planomonospora corallina TaxID=1806052 RepID=A0ABV8IAH3_9ACTN
MTAGTVLFAWRRIPPPFLIGGAEVSQQLLAEEFTASGWDTHYLASHEPPWSTTSDLPAMLQHLAAARIPFEHRYRAGELRYTCNGVAVRAVPQERLAGVLDGMLDDLAPDLVVTSMEGAADLAAAARSRAVVAGWLHSVSATSVGVLGGDPHYALATSRFVLERTPPSQTAVLFYPPFRPAPMEGAAGGGDLLMVNPVPAKGAELMHRLAELLPDRRFTLVEGWWDTSAEFARHPNVTYVPRTYDMGALYRRHRLLLVPSTVDDAFPRVIVEAALAGLPAAGSTRGGIPEAITDPDLLAPPGDHTAWTALIRSLTPALLDEAAAAAYRRAVPMARACLPELAAAGVIPT